MDPLAVPDKPADGAQRPSRRSDLRLAGWVLLLCAWDAGMSVLFEVAAANGQFDRVARVWQICALSLLCIVPGVLVARLSFPGLPTTPRRCVQLVAAFVVGSAVGDAIAFLWIPFYPDSTVSMSLRLFAFNLGTYAIMATFIVGALYWWIRGSAIEHELHKGRIGLLALQADRADAELLRLRTQIEPHFLFNTLATILQMYRGDVAGARRTLAKLIEYMDVSRAHMRRQEATLQDELALVEGYLDIQRLRLGGRLRYAIDVPGELRETRIPPAALLTLVENAIKHGLAPHRGGGEVRVTAQREADAVVVTVVDDGIGLRATGGRGLGLANVRARLEGLYGAGASLRLVGRREGGAIATVRVPSASTMASLATA
jgi:sensor histidine kinase YesM